MEINNIAIGKRLNLARKDMKLSMKEVGLLVDLHESSVQRYEAGLVKNVSIEKLKEFAKVLNIEASYLIGWTEKEIIKKEELHSFTVKLVQELLEANIIKDKDNIPQAVIDAIISSLKLDLNNKKTLTN